MWSIGKVDASVFWFGDISGGQQLTDNRQQTNLLYKVLTAVACINNTQKYGSDFVKKSSQMG